MTPVQMNAVSAGQRVRAHRLRATIWIAAVLAVLAALPLFISSYQTSIATQVLIFSVLAMSINILAGYAGRTSLGHGAIFGVSAYVAIYWTYSMGGNPGLGSRLELSRRQRFRQFLACWRCRTSGVYFLLLTLALGMIVWGVCLRWTGITGGENGLRGIGRPDFIADDKDFYSPS